MSTTRVLVVEDEPNVVEFIESYLVRAGMDVTTAMDGPAGLDAIRRWRPDVVVLDVMLPGIDGFEVLRQARAFSDAYVIMLTARAEEVDRIVGLSVGADDYLVKPFSPRELVARIQALLRRPRATGGGRKDGAWSVGELRMDPRRRSVERGGNQVTLTALEFDLLAALIREPGVVYTRQQLLDRVWGEDFVGDEHVVDVHMASVRRKLGDDAARPRIIETVRGVGYRLRDVR